MGDTAVPTRELAADATVQAADKLIRSAPNQLDVDYMEMLENIAKYSPAIDLASNSAGSYGRRMYSVLG